MTDWVFPKLTQTWANFLAALKGRDESNAKMDYSADSNIPDGTVRWSATNSRFEIWDATGSTWNVLSSKYLINVDTVDGEHNTDFASAVGGSGSRQAKDADTVDGVHLPGTIAQVLTNHDKAAHDALNINADTVDGLHASQFLRSDATDITSGQLRVHDDLFIGGGSPTAPEIKLQLGSTPAPSGWARGLRVEKGAVLDFGLGLLGNGSSVTHGFIGMGASPWANGLRIDSSGRLATISGNNELWNAGNVSSAPGLNNSKATTGYVDLPGGLILQWGQISVSSNSTAVDNFAKTFPTACLQATCSGDRNGSSDNASVAGFTTTTITVGGSHDSGTMTIHWMAIGY